MPNWAVQLIVAIVVIIGLIVLINVLGDNGAFSAPLTGG